MVAVILGRQLQTPSRRTRAGHATVPPLSWPRAG